MPQAKAKFASVVVRSRRAESPATNSTNSNDNNNNDNKNKAQGYVAESIIKNIMHILLAPIYIHFFSLLMQIVLLSALRFQCLQSLFYLMHKSVCEIYKNCIYEFMKSVGI